MSRPLIGSSRLFAHGYCLYVALSVGSERDEAPRLFLSVNVDRDHSLMRRERAFSYALAFEYRCGTRRWKGVRVICDEKSNWEFEAGRVDQLQFEKGYVKGGVRKLCIKWDFMGLWGRGFDRVLEFFMVLRLLCVCLFFRFLICFCVSQTVFLIYIMFSYYFRVLRFFTLFSRNLSYCIKKLINITQFLHYQFLLSFWLCIFSQSTLLTWMPLQAL